MKHLLKNIYAVFLVLIMQSTGISQVNFPLDINIADSLENVLPSMPGKGRRTLNPRSIDNGDFNAFCSNANSTCHLKIKGIYGR